MPQDNPRRKAPAAGSNPFVEPGLDEIIQTFTLSPEQMPREGQPFMIPGLGEFVVEPGLQSQPADATVGAEPRVVGEISDRLGRRFGLRRGKWRIRPKRWSNQTGGEPFYGLMFEREL